MQIDTTATLFEPQLWDNDLFITCTQSKDSGQPAVAADRPQSPLSACRGLASLTIHQAPSEDCECAGSCEFLPSAHVLEYIFPRFRAFVEWNTVVRINFTVCQITDIQIWNRRNGALLQATISILILISMYDLRILQYRFYHEYSDTLNPFIPTDQYIYLCKQCRYRRDVSSGSALFAILSLGFDWNPYFATMGVFKCRDGRVHVRNSGGGGGGRGWKG